MRSPAAFRYVVLLSVVGCAGSHAPTQAAPERPWREVNAARLSANSSDWVPEGEPLTSDLGLSGAGASDSVLAQLLSHRLSLPARVSVGVLHLRGTRARRWWAPGETNEASQELADSAVAFLRAGTRVERASVLPGMLVGDQQAIAVLREAAARLQVDLLLVYRPSCRLYERVPFLGNLQWRSVCTLEAVAIDTRTGLLPFSLVATNEQVTQRQRGEFQDAESQNRGQLGAMLQALRTIVSGFNGRLMTVPVAVP